MCNDYKMHLIGSWFLVPLLVFLHILQLDPSHIELLKSVYKVANASTVFIVIKKSLSIVIIH